MKKRLLIIGGDSFIAKQFFYKYKNSFEFVIISRKKTYNHNSEIVVDDLFKLEKTTFNKIDTVINFAAIVHQSNIKDWNIYKKVNIDLPIYIAHLACKNNVNQFIQMSSISVYGNKQYIDMNTEPKPNTLYGHSKLKCDLKLQQMNNSYFRVLSIRPPMIYGGGDAPGNMMKLIRLISLMRYRIPLPLNSKAKRSFINVANLIDYIYHSIENSLNGICLVTDDEETVIKDLTNLICDELALKPIFFKPGKPLIKLIKYFSNNIHNSLFQDLVIKGNYNASGFTPGHSLSEGISTMVESFKNIDKVDNK